MKIVFDIGGTRLRVASSRDGATIGEPVVHPTPPKGEEGIALMVKTAKELSRGEGVESITGGFAGSVGLGVVESSTHLPKWGGTSFLAAFEENFPGALARVENDALVGALGEARLGAGRGYEVVAYVTIGTGIGGARIVRGVLDPAESAEPGKQILDGSQAKTFEELASGPALLKRYQVKDVTELSDNQIAEAATLLARGLYNTVVHWEPDVLVLGGGVVAREARITKAVSVALSRMTTEVPLPPIVGAHFGEWSVLMGALELV
jgi:glucokinase